jgi:hypothetical protein
MYKIIGADSKEYGPVSAEQLRQWLREGRVNSQTKVKPADAAEWATFAALPEFANALSADLPPPIAPPTTASSGGGGWNAIIPYKNARALTAYYLAIFSLIPLIGLPLGLAAFVLGILGLKFRRQHPTAGGTVHAWIGIILGGLCGFGHLALVFWAIIAAASRH